MNFKWSLTSFYKGLTISITTPDVGPVFNRAYFKNILLKFTVLLHNIIVLLIKKEN